MTLYKESSKARFDLEHIRYNLILISLDLDVSGIGNQVLLNVRSLIADVDLTIEALKKEVGKNYAGLIDPEITHDDF